MEPTTQELRLLGYVADCAADARARIEAGEDPATAAANLTTGELDELRGLLDDLDDGDAEGA